VYRQAMSIASSIASVNDLNKTQPYPSRAALHTPVRRHAPTTLLCDAMRFQISGVSRAQQAGPALPSCVVGAAISDGDALWREIKCRCSSKLQCARASDSELKLKSGLVSKEWYRIPFDRYRMAHWHPCSRAHCNTLLVPAASSRGTMCYSGPTDSGAPAPTATPPSARPQRQLHNAALRTPRVAVLPRPLQHLQVPASPPTPNKPQAPCWRGVGGRTDTRSVGGDNVARRAPPNGILRAYS
jgi:hypothetical protein